MATESRGQDSPGSQLHPMLCVSCRMWRFFISSKKDIILEAFVDGRVAQDLQLWLYIFVPKADRMSCLFFLEK